MISEKYYISAIKLLGSFRVPDQNKASLIFPTYIVILVRAMQGVITIYDVFAIGCEQLISCIFPQFHAAQ